MSGTWTLLRLASPQLPIGAYSYSQGLESAIELDVVHDMESTHTWLADQLALNIACFEAPLLARMLEAAAQEEWEQLLGWAKEYTANRETCALRNESQQMGFSLMRLLSKLPNLDEETRCRLHGIAEPSLPLAWAFAARIWGLSTRDALAAWVY